MKKPEFKKFFDISIPFRFDQEQPNVYGVDPAVSKVCEYGEFVGDTRRGGSVNFEQYTFIPHCHGTHTECVGHITDDRIAVRDCLKGVLSEALLITVEPVKAIECGEKYTSGFEENDTVITRASLETSLENINGNVAESLVLRTSPNDKSKLTRNYNKDVPPYFTNEAIRFITDHFEHLLVDLPSIDRIYDGGALSNHRLFWNVKPDSKVVTAESRVNSTVTEMIYVPNEIKDGGYLLNLQITAFETDATPSRPVLLVT